MAYYLDGRVSVLAGTHTHVQTADERILPKGTAYISDLGMTGSLDGIIGMDRKICLDRARNQVLYRMEVSIPDEDGKTAVQGILAEIDAECYKAFSIKRFSV
jgi:calcineurin-like phosphoesterase